MDNISMLFENLMTYNETNNTKKRVIKPIKENKQSLKEEDSTILNLSVEIPTDKEDITPDDVDVNVGVMTLDNDEDVDTEDTDEVTVDNETDKENEVDDEEEKDTNESLKRKHFEAFKRYKESKIRCTGKEDCKCKECLAKKESNDVETAKANILKRVKVVESSEENPDPAEVLVNMADAYFDGDDEYLNETEMDITGQIISEMEDEGLEPGDVDECNNFLKAHPEYVDAIVNSNVYQNWFMDESCTAKKIKKESLSKLDTTTLNRLITTFVRDNYKNIDKVVINKAVLENHTLTLKGSIKDLSGKTEAISLVNRGFNTKKCENKRFIIDFTDASNTFNIVKENIKKPFIFTANMKNGILTFENLRYRFKTKVNENKTVELKGNCMLTEGLFDKKTKEFVKSQMNAVSGFDRKVTPADDGLGFTVEFDGKEKEKFINDLTREGYKGELGVYNLEKDKQKIKCTIQQDKLSGDENGRCTAKFTARKKELK